MKKWTLAIAAAAVAVGAAFTVSPSIASDTAFADEHEHPINAKCPIMGGKSKHTVTVKWGEKTVGFCCPPCIKKWNALSDEAKASKLAKVTVPVNAKCPIMGGKAKGAVAVAWNNKTVGFCCPPCIPKWNALSEEQKTAKLAASMK